jgi:GNAT superfamily N-acetyltransferase
MTRATPMTVRELEPGETHLAAAALLALRPAYTVDALVERVDAVQRPGGYRLAASFADGAAEAASAAGFRILENLAWGRALYVDDLSTLPDARGAGHADALFAWLAATAEREGCDEFHLDSGVAPERETAHRFYFNHGLRIASYHFSRGV